MRSSFLHYEIIDKLGEGGMGLVHLARDTKLNRKVALKFLPAYSTYDKSVQQRFRNEAKAAAALNHINAAQIYAIEEADDELFLVMEYVRGSELSEHIRNADLSMEDKLKIARQIAQGLQAAHNRGIVHRDIKSSNIMIDEEGNAKIMDFGLARFRGSAHITKTGSTVGTLAYMSPELVVGNDADERSDIWSFGVVMYELLTGTLPFKGIYDQAVTYAILEENPKPISEINSDIPPNLIGIVNRCLEKDPDDRYISFDEIISDLADPEYQYEQKGKDTKTKKNSWLITGSFSKVLMTVAALLLLLFPIIKYAGFGWFATPSVPYEKGLAILPFKKIGQTSSSNINIVADGLLETLTGKLTQVGNYEGALWVIPASEVIEGKVNTPSDALKEFSVNLVIAGSLQEVDDYLKFVINLVDTESLRQISSREVTSHQDSLSNLQADSERALLDMLNIEIRPEIHRVITVGESDKPVASQYYLNGRGYLLRYENSENINDAIDAFQRAVKEDPEFALAHAALAESYWRMYEFSDEVQYVEKAKENIKRAVEIDNKLVQVIATQGLINHGTGAKNEAIKNFNEVLQMAPGNDMAFRQLAQIYAEQGELDKAEKNLKLAIQLKPNYWKGYDDLGMFYLNYGVGLDKAIEQFQHILQIEPDSYLGYLHLGAAYLRKGNTKLALQYLEKSLEIRETFAVANNLGALHYMQENYSEAIRFYSIAHNLNPNSYAVSGNLASAHEKLGNNDIARNYYLKAISIAKEQLQVNPNDGEIINDLGVYYADLGEHEEALTYLRRSIELDANNVEVLFRTAAAYERMGDRNNALIWIEKALQRGLPMERIRNLPELENLIADSQFKNIIAKIEGP